MARLVFVIGLFIFSAAHSPVWAQSSDDGMAGMDGMSDAGSSFIESIERHATSGSDVQPASTPANMVMRQHGSWMLMLHGEAFINELQESGPRGSGKFFSTNWIMPMAQRSFANGTLTLRTMLSLEPVTVSQRRYPELFQQGETAFGKPIVDGQHPHNLFMEIAALYDYKLGERALLSIYAAPVGDPALGPSAYAHRSTASENPMAPLGHHLQDSTHISDDVITAGITYKTFRVEASGFHGREPDENRWHISAGSIDSWSARLTFNPGKNWSAQYSIAHLTSLEQLFPHEDVRRMTASLMYNRPIHNGNWASLVWWGRNQSLQDGNVGTGYLLESTLQFLSRNNAWTRIENVDRTNELLLGNSTFPPGFVERYFTRVQAYSFGYDRELGHIPHLSTALGAQFTAYGLPAALSELYSPRPFGIVGFLRLRAE